MIGKIITLSIGLISSAWALPWFSPANEVKTSTPMTKSDANPVNFSGVWVGACDFKSAPDLTIKHEGDRLSISYGFMEDKYKLGELKSSALSHATGSEHENGFASLIPERQAIIFINSSLFRNNEGHANAFFSKVTMVLSNERLTVRGRYFQTDEGVEEILEDVVSCVYHLKRGN